MPCAVTHRIVNFSTSFLYLASRPKERQYGIAHPLVGAAATTALAGLPDAIEPAIHPHHRQFFHSIAFAGLVGFGVYKAYHWQTETPEQKWLKLALIVSGSAYLLHLAADFTTARSLPLLGK